MDADTPKAEELNLPQAFLLLATNDKDGEPEVPAYVLRTTLAGAILAELDLIGAIELEGKRVRATGAAPETDLQHELELIRHKSRPHSPKRWVSILESRAEEQRIYEGLASRGIVEAVGEKRLGLFKRVRYPERDHAPEAALLEKMQAAVTSGVSAMGQAGAKALDTRTKALLALLHAAGLLEKLFPTVDRVRMNELTNHYWPSRAVEDELRMIRLAEEEAPAL